MKDKTTLKPEQFEKIKGTLEAHQYYYNEGRQLYVKNIRNIRGVAEARRKAKKFILYTEVAGQELYLTPEGKLSALRKEATQFCFGFDDTNVRCDYWQKVLGVKFRFRNFESEKKISKKEQAENEKRAIENEKMRNYEKFFTPSSIATMMVNLLKPRPGKEYLEPSAGNGKLIRAVKSKQPECRFVAFEINKDHKKALLDIAEGVYLRDFLASNPLKHLLDGCIANPPFGNGVDLRAHINKMRTLVKSRGRIVTIVPKSFQLGIKHKVHKIENWSKNSDGTTTPIKIIEFINP